MFPYSPLLWSLTFPKALNVTELKPSSVPESSPPSPSWGEEEKGDQEQKLTKKQKGKGQGDQKKNFLKKWAEEEEER